MNTQPLILIVDDDPHIRDVVRFALQKAGLRTAEAADGRQAIARFDELSPALLVLDILMPELDGTDVCRAIRSRSSVPIVFLSSRDDEIDRIVGLEMGGDDYITKPFSPRELVARVRAVLRRVAPPEGHHPPASPTGGSTPGTTVDPRVLVHGRLKIDLDRFKVFWGEVELVLTVTELGIVRTLLGFPGKVFTRDELMDGAYTYDNVVSDRTIDSHVRRVRRKFSDAGGDPIETVHGLGYKLGDCR